MKSVSPFSETGEFRELNVCLTFDEGQFSPDEEFCVYYGERIVW